MERRKHAGLGEHCRWHVNNWSIAHILHGARRHGTWTVRMYADRGLWTTERRCYAGGSNSPLQFHMADLVVLPQIRVGA